MRKVYEYRNKAEAELVIVSPSGRTKYKFRFAGGIMDPKNLVHAKHTTDSAIMQHALENSEYFNKTVFLVGTFDSPAVQTPAYFKKAKETEKPEEVKTAAKPKAAKKTKDEKADNAPEIKVMEDVTDPGVAASILLAEGDVKAADIETVEGIIRKAKELGFSFPNLKA